MQTRRDFLRTLALSAVAAPALLTACRKSPPDPGQPKGPSLQSLADERVAAGATAGLSVFLAGADYASGLENYVGLGLVEQATGPIPGGAAQIWMVPSSDPAAEVEPLGPFDAAWQEYSSPQSGGPPGIHAADLRFDRAGIWTLLVELDAGDRKLIGNAAVTVQAEPLNKAPGDKAIASLTPTVDNRRGVDPICTRKPPCPLHEITLASAIRSDKPTAFIFGTPAFCESRTCGPNLDELLAVREEVSSRVNFIHAEVYENDGEAVAKAIVSPTFKEWGFQSEPWIYLIDRRGVIAARYEGPVVASRIQRDLVPLLK